MSFPFFTFLEKQNDRNKSLRGSLTSQHLSLFECIHIFKENLVEQMQKQTLCDSWCDLLKIPYVVLLPKSLT